MIGGQVWEWIIGAIARLVGALKGAVAGFVGKFLGAYGLTMVTFNGVLPNLKSFVMGYITGMPGDALNMLGALGVGAAMSMILSALSIRMAWKVFVVPTSVADSLSSGS